MCTYDHLLARSSRCRSVRPSSRQPKDGGGAGGGTNRSPASLYPFRLRGTLLRSTAGVRVVSTLAPTKKLNNLTMAEMYLEYGRFLLWCTSTEYRNRDLARQCFQESLRVKETTHGCVSTQNKKVQRPQNSKFHQGKKTICALVCLVLFDSSHCRESNKTKGRGLGAKMFFWVKVLKLNSLCCHTSLVECACKSKSDQRGGSRSLQRVFEVKIKP